MKPSISRKMDMVKDVFLNNKRVEESIAFAEFIDTHDEMFYDDYSYPELLMEGNSRKKVSTKKNKISNKKICRIKNNKGEYVDIKKVKQDDTSLLELPPPEGDENLISIGNQMSIPESLRLLEKIKRGKKKFKDFISQKPRLVTREKEEISTKKP